VYAYDVGDTFWVDVGTPETYLNALLLSLSACNDASLMQKAYKALSLKR